MTVLLFVGLLGSGKSQLALKYGCIFREDHLGGLCWRIACQSTLTLLNSLKRLADALGLVGKDNTKQNENISNNESLISLRRLILNELRKSVDGKFEHLLILDDVTEETKHSCKKLKDSVLKLEVKIIATTWNSAFCDEENLITVTGFTEEEAVDFLQQKKGTKTEDEKHYKDLAQQLGYLPMALYGARTCMRSSHMTPKRFIKYLKGGRSLSEIDKFVKSSSSENRELFEVLTQFLEILKNDERGDVFDMVLVLQFLAIEDIPVLLFDFLPTTRNQKYQELNTENFIQAVQKFSFGVLHGEDEDRFINTHLAVVRTIAAYTQIDDKVRLCKKLLTALMLLMDKDNYNPKDYSRNNNLMQHAISILEHVKILQDEIPGLSEDFELNILLAYVYDLVGYIFLGYTYNFFGILKNAGEYSIAARDACFALIGVSEVNIENTVRQACTRNEHHTTWEEFANHKANLIVQKVKEQMAVPENYEVLQKLAKHMVLNKYRAKDHIEILQRYLGHDLKEEYILTESEYRRLRDKQLAFPEDDLGQMFLFELIIQVFYTFGRRIFYLGDAYERSIARIFSSDLFLAHALSKVVAEQYTQWKLLYIMLTELSGTLEQIFDDKADLHLQTLENLEMAAERFKVFLNSNTTHFVFGVVKTDPEDIQHMHICYKRLVRCYTSMTSLTTDEKKLAEIHEKGQLYARKLEDSKWSYRQISANLRMTEFSLLHKDLDEAEDKFKMVAPDDMVQSTAEMGKTPLSLHELQALKGLTQCYTFSGKIELAKILAQRIKDRLALTKVEKELEHFKKVIFDLKLFD
jgi:hypothetical protein